METAVILFVVLLSSSWCRSSAILAPVDYLALQSIRKSLSDLPGSSFFARWDFTGDPCAFPGVFCSGNRVVALALGDPRTSSPGLAGCLSPALGRLFALAQLSLVPGRVIGPIPPTSPSTTPFASSPSAITSLQHRPHLPRLPSSPPHPQRRLQPPVRLNPSSDRRNPCPFQPHPLPQPPLRPNPSLPPLLLSRPPRSKAQLPLRHGFYRAWHGPTQNGLLELV